MSDFESADDSYSNDEQRDLSSVSEENSEPSESVNSEEWSSDGNEFLVVNEPYQEEPLAPPGEIENENEADQDGLTPETLAQREDGTIPLAAW